jgi:anaerobic selenocysteine-containing dehydrogenase
MERLHNWSCTAGSLTPWGMISASDHYKPIAWDAALKLMAGQLNALPEPNEVEFYVFGRTSDQLFTREFGTNNFPDCSNIV